VEDANHHIGENLKEKEMNRDELIEKVASRIIVDCGYGSDEPCPHEEPVPGYEKCQHLDEDVCIWQREQAKKIIPIITSEIRKELSDIGELKKSLNEKWVPSGLVLLSKKQWQSFWERWEK
jgi:hypothetical protein